MVCVALQPTGRYQSGPMSGMAAASCRRSYSWRQLIVSAISLPTVAVTQLDRLLAVEEKLVDMRDVIQRAERAQENDGLIQ